MSQGNRILAIDPGSKKCGLAVLERDGSVVAKAVVGSQELGQRVEQLLSSDIRQVVLGGGTGSRLATQAVRPVCESRGVTLVTAEETYSTEMARRLYFRENPPRGWRRLIPTSFQMPCRPFDDYGAVVIGQRYLSKTRSGC